MPAQLEVDEMKYRLLFDASPIPAWIVDADGGRFLAVNDAAVQHYGYSRDEFLTMSIQDIRLCEETGQLSRFVPAQASAAPVLSGLWHHRHRDGSIHRVQLTAATIDHAGKPALLTLVLNPEREGASEVLKVRERQLADAQALARVGSWEWDIPANHATWSDEMYRIYDVVIGSPAGYTEFMERVHPEDRERVAALIADGLARCLPTFEYESRVLRANGEIRYLLNRHMITVDAGGKPIRMAGTCHDITDRRRAELALADSERQHRQMVENSSDIVTILSPEGVIQYMSPSVYRLLGYRSDESPGHNISELIHRDDLPAVMEALCRDLASPGTPNPAEFRFRHRDGRWRILEAMGQAYEMQPGTWSIIVNSRDVTERKLAEEGQRALLRELRTAREVAESATRAKSEFLANMSHEIRTPMNAILGLTEIVLDSELKPEQRHHLEMVRDSGDVLLTLLNDILDLSKIEAEHLELETIPLDLRALVHASADLFAVTAQERGLELAVNIGADVPRMVRADPTRLRQVLSNLIGNAVKFTPHGQITISVQELRVGQPTLRFAIRDTGIGIPADRLSSLFEEFKQVDSSTTRRYGGTGLGLAIAQKLVRLMGGDISVTSTVGRGSEFCFTLPLPVASNSGSRDSAPAGSASAADGQTHPAPTEPRIRLRILLAEDNLVNQEVAAAMLRKRGHTVTIVDNGAKAVEAVKGSMFDLVLMDIHMPEMDGLTATAAIRKLAGGAGLPIIALTADALTGEWQHCLAAGMSGYLAKPFNSRDLIAMVEGWGPPSAAATQELDDAPAPADLEQFQNMMREAGVEHAVGDILNTFIAEAPRRCSDLAAAIAAEHAGDIRAAAHAFKSAVGTIGARSLFSILVGIEQAGKDNRIHDARALEPSMHRECDAVIAYLRGRRAGEPTHA